MVALLVQLKLTLLRNSLRRSVWRTVGLVLAAVYALGIVVAVYAGLVALRWTSTTTTGEVTVLVYAGLTLGWLMLSLLVFGVDETVDPARFALLPVRARDLVPGLLAAALVGVPGVATALVALGLVVTWARTPALALAALVAAVLGTLTCVLLSRTATSAFAAFLSSRRFRDVAAVLLALVGAFVGIGANLLGRAAEGEDVDALPALLARAASAGVVDPVRLGLGRCRPTSRGAPGGRPPRTSCWRWPSSSACGRPGRTSSASAWSSPPSAAPGAAGSWPAAGSSGSSPRTRPARSPSGRCATGAATRATSPCWPATSSPRSCSS